MIVIVMKEYLVQKDPRWRGLCPIFQVNIPYQKEAKKDPAVHRTCFICLARNLRRALQGYTCKSRAKLHNGTETNARLARPL